MAGRVIRILNKTRVNLSASAVNSNTQEILLAEHIDVSQFRELVAYIRLHSGSTQVSSSGWTITPRLIFYCDGTTSEDTSFTALNSQGTNFKVLPTTAPPVLDVFALPTNLGGLLTMSIQAQSSGAGANCDVWMSVDLSGKE